MSRTKKPCPGCGEVDPYRSLSEVCGNCRGALDSYRVLVDSIENSINMGHVTVKNLHGTWHWQPYITGPNRDTVQKLFLELCESLGQRTWRETGGGGWHYGILRGSRRDSRKDALIKPSPRNRHVSNENPDCQHLMPTDTAKILPQIYLAISNLADECYLEGHQKGRDLLMSLHNGDITMADFEERLAKTDEVYSAD